ncbi:hypothetical protein Pyn_36666 [Prunus yedoensis var. nudiflora]|uniref:Uncharacterized protein n=1 Tax=Prunus yedoensis var. nudiflora TaxID=2094558 RepID=A0A314YMU9_PRUYE|nr:hypothetical protein Pyn_36666 [Prunus yedoensis var. nudiflora]
MTIGLSNSLINLESRLAIGFVDEWHSNPSSHPCGKKRGLPSHPSDELPAFVACRLHIRAEKMELRAGDFIVKPRGKDVALYRALNFSANVLELTVEGLGPSIIRRSCYCCH